jgi:hypothetical protein
MGFLNYSEAIPPQVLVLDNKISGQAKYLSKDSHTISQS